MVSAFAKRVALVAVLLVSAFAVFGDNPTGIEIRTQDPGVSVYVNEEFRGKTADVWGMFSMLRVEDLPPGTHRVRCEFENYQPFETEVVVEAGQVTPIEVEFVRSRVRVESMSEQRGTQVMQTGSIAVRSTPTRAYMTLNDRDRSTTDGVYHDVPVGEHTVDVFFDRNDPEKHLSIDVNVVAETTVTVNANFLTGEISHDGRYAVSIFSEPPGTLTINGRDVGILPQTLDLTGGRHSIRIERSGYTALETEIDVRHNDMVRFTLERIETELRVRTVPHGAAVTVRNAAGRETQIGFSPITHRLEPGTYTVRATARNHIEESREIVLTEDQPEVTAKLVLEPELAYVEIRADSEFEAEQKVLLGGRDLGEAPIARTTVPAGSHTLSIGTLTEELEFSRNRRYVLQPMLPYPIKGLISSADELPNAPRVPSKPELLSETKTVRRPDHARGAWIGGLVGGGIGLVISIGDSSIEADEAVVGILLTSAIGALWGALTPPSRTEFVVDEDNRRRNQQMMAEWERRKREVEGRRDSMVADENRVRREHNMRAEQENADRGVVVIEDQGPYEPSTVYSETFSSGAGGWFVSTDENRTWEVNDAAYRAVNRTDRTYRVRRSVPEIDQAVDFEIEATLRRLAGPENSSYGLFWGATDDWDNTPYVVLMNANQRFYVGKTVDRQWESMVPWTSNTAVRADDSNTIRIQKSGTTYRLFINGDKAGEWPFTPAPGRFIGVTVGGGLTVELDAITIRQHPQLTR